jgi:hypothetical protein
MIIRAHFVLPMLVLAACGGGSSSPSTGDISSAFTAAGASNVVVVPSSVWQSALSEGQVNGVPVEGLKSEMGHIEGEVGGTFDQSIFLIQVMDSNESAQALAQRIGATPSTQQGMIVSKVLVNGRLVGSYAGDRGHVAVFTKTFNGL